MLHPGEDWHGFGDIEDGYCMLDPIKVSVVTPGVAENGRALPASWRRSSPHICTSAASKSKRPPTSRSCSSSRSASPGQVGTLLNALLDFKTHYELNARLIDVMPKLAAAHPDR